MIEICKKGDIEEILNIQRVCYPESLYEEGNVFLSILEISEYSYVIKENKKIIGYIFSHLWDKIDNPPSLHDDVPYSKGENIFIHDIVIHPDYQNRGYAKMLLDRIYNIPNIKNYIIVAVNGAYKFWERQGFKEREIDKEKIKTYGVDCMYMIK